ncbi:hypothetical protein C4564_00195 [Candidatus Microgenomates bacterium]|nr:MAG: hypothetical protein C4564_00195 [Candidatus Microgenomates bacterium]
MERGPEHRANAILGIIVDYVNHNHYPPTVREICDMTGIASTSLVDGYMSRLEKDGSIENDGGSRAIRVTLEPSPIRFEKRD